jgi:hypothetical protein
MCHPPFSPLLPVVHPPAHPLFIHSSLHMCACPRPTPGTGHVCASPPLPFMGARPRPTPGTGHVCTSLPMYACHRPTPGTGHLHGQCDRSTSHTSFPQFVHASDPLLGLATCALPPNPPYVCMPQTHSRDWALAWQVWQTHISHFLPPIRACLRPTPGTGHVRDSPESPLCVHASDPLPGLAMCTLPPLCVNASDPLQGLATCMLPPLCVHASDPLPGLATCMLPPHSRANRSSSLRRTIL